tara:strand:- start:2624 stop:2953 length:330 start_codon:yes stop_codon:yes gene_type:complete
MGMVQTSVAAATAVVGYDLLVNTTYKSSNLPRRIIAVALAGSAAALDTEAQVMVGNTEVARIFNSATGAPNRDSMFRVGAAVPANQEIMVRIVDAPATNPINLALDIEG